MPDALFFHHSIRHMLRNSIGACAMVQNTHGRGKSFYPVSYSSPPPQYMHQTNPTMATGSTTTASPQFNQMTQVDHSGPPPQYLHQTSLTIPAISASAASPQFYQTTPTAAYLDAALPKRSAKEQMNVPALMEVAHPSAAGMTITSPKNSVQVAKAIP